jgi:hypothetical protein
VEVVARAGDAGQASDLVSEEEATTEAIHAAAHPGRDRAQEAAEAEVGAEARIGAEAGSEARP